MAAIKAPEAERVRVYGDLAKVDLRSATAVEAQTENLPLPDSLKFLQSKTDSLLESPSQVLSRTTAGVTNKLELRIHKVRCVEDTPGWGRDEIDLGGNTVDESGDTENISAFRVGKFKSGEEVNYSPPRIFAAFDLLENPNVKWPRSYSTTLALAEIDLGRFPDFLNKFFDKVKEEVIKAVKEALGDTGDIVIFGTTVGEIVGTVVGWVVSGIFNWLREVWNDDIFAPITLRADISSLDAPNPQGGEVSFKDQGGEYRLYYDWRIEVLPTHPTPAWAVMGDEAILSVGVSSWNSEVMDLFVRGTDNQLYYKWYTNSGGWMQGYEQLGGEITFSPAAVSGGGSDLIDVFVAVLALVTGFTTRYGKAVCGQTGKGWGLWIPSPVPVYLGNRQGTWMCSCAGQTRRCTCISTTLTTAGWVLGHWTVKYRRVRQPLRWLMVRFMYSHAGWTTRCGTGGTTAVGKIGNPWADR